MSSLPDPRLIPLASIRLYDKGQGDPYLTDRGFGWYQPVADIYKIGSVTYSGVQPTLEYVEGVGIVCRPFLEMQDTRLADFSFHAAADWDERKPTSGAPRTYRLVQTSSAADLQWYARSSYSLPENPHVAVSLIVPDTPPDHNATLYPPYVRVELGDGQWILEWSKIFGGRLLADVAGALGVVAELPGLSSIGRDVDESLIMIRPMRGKIGISMDAGRHYEWYGDPAGYPVGIRAGKIRVSGQGGQVIFGVHQLRYVAGSYTSPTKNTYARRIFLPPAPTFVTRGEAPAGTSVAIADLSVPGNAIAQWKATLTPASSPGPTGWSVYRTPELYAVQMTYPVARAGNWRSYTTPWDGSIVEINIDRPVELDGGTATVRVNRDQAKQFTYRHGMWPKVQIFLGHQLAAGGEEWQTSFTGYIRSITPAQRDYGQATLDLAIENVTTRFRRTTWIELDAIPLGGQTLNAALDYVLASEGLQAQDRIWHWLGDRILLPAGTAEEPAFWPRPGETKWETLEEICRWCGMEIGALTDGRLTTVPVDYVEPWVTHQWDWTPSLALHELVLDASYSLDSGESVTATIVRGEDEYGNAGWAYAIDVEAELYPSSVRFRPWRETREERIDGATSLGFLALAARSLLLANGTPKQRLELSTPVQLGLRRRQRVQLLGSTIGVSDYDEFAILTLRHTYRADPSFASLTTQAGLIRIV